MGQGGAPAAAKPNPSDFNSLKGKTALFYEAKARRAKFLDAVAQGQTPRQVCEAMEISYNTYLKWRARFKDFAGMIDAAREGVKASDLGRTWDGGFASFRSIYFKHDSPWHHNMIIDILENGREGEVVMVLIFPESGKTTTLEDYCSFKLALDPSFRITVGSETQNHARKVLRRVKGRMEPTGPAKEYVMRFGPFVPQTGGKRKSQQPWGADYFDVFKKESFDERDYSMVALGATSQIAGTRTDLLIPDDMQSRKNLNQTERLVEDFRQDWLSRPGEHGRTVIIGTRVGIGDFYETLLSEGVVDRLIKIPAIIKDDDGTEKATWPEYWPLDKLARQKVKVGPDAWHRNYMQDPQAAGDSTFTPEMIGECKNPLLSVNHEPSEGSILYLGLDPALGSTNAMVIGKHDPAGKLIVCDAIKDMGFTRNEQIMVALERQIVRYQRNGTSITDVVIEAMNFQKGLANDQRLREMSEFYGFRITPHLTGVNKYDENIGVPSMALSFLRRDIVLPWADDDQTRDHVGSLEQELISWRPKERGSRLRQDLVMALWFMWILWRGRGTAAAADADQFRFKGSPYQLTKSGLAVVKSKIV